MDVDEETAVMAKGTLWQNAGSIAFKLLSFVYTILIARLVSQDEVGAFYFALGIVGMVALFADFGLTTAIVRYVPYFLGKRDRESAQKVLNLTVFGSSALLLLASVSLFLLAPPIADFFSNPALGPVLLLMAFYLSVGQTYNIANSILISHKRMHESVIGSSLQSILKIAFALILIFSLGADAKSLSIAFTASYAVSAVYLMFAMRGHLGWVKKAQGISLEGHVALISDILPFGIMAVGVMLFTSVISYTDRLMLGYMLGDSANAQIAIYSIATGLAGIVAIFAASVAGIFYPLVSELVGRGDMQKVAKTSATAVRWVLFSSIPVLAFLLAFANPMLRVLYGAAYEPGWACMMLFSIGLFVSYVGSIPRTALAGMRLVKIELLSVVCAAAANVALNFALIPGFGVNGSAFASMVAFLVMSLVNYYYAQKLYGFSLPAGTGRHLAAGAALAALLFGLQIFAYPPIGDLLSGIGDGSVALLVADKSFKLAAMGIFFFIGCGIYVAMLNLLGLLLREDRAVFGRTLRKLGLPHPAAALAERAVFWGDA